jgi:outer membrane receptor protein involved in Fe transport
VTKSAMGGLLGLLSLLACAADPAAAVDGAQPAIRGSQGESGSGQLEEVVVTAQKRSESLQSVPLSVAALTADALEQRGISGVASLMSGDVPSVKVEPFAGNQSVLEVSIRGFIKPNGSDITNENPVPIYIDDVYYGRQICTALELNDLDRIEVLRGPQGTLFGKNAAGGAVRLISKEPTGEFGVVATAEGFQYEGKPGKDLGAGGKLTLWSDGVQIGAGRLEKTLKYLFSVLEGLDVGADYGSPVSDHYPFPFPFHDGELSSVAIDLE